MNALSMPTRKDETFRYSDLEALERIWSPETAKPRKITVKPGEQQHLLLSIPVITRGVALSRLQIDIGEGARFSLHVLAIGADYGRIEVDVTLHRAAHFELGGAILAHGNQNQEIITHVRHIEPEATSNQIVRSVLAGTATGSFLGKVSVARHAQKTDAKQSVKAMLLNRAATANAKPELEILADDVLCAHGATVGELDAKALFYLAARGLPPEEAKKLMLQAFIADSFANIEDDDQRESISSRALTLLGEML